MGGNQKMTNPRDEAAGVLASVIVLLFIGLFLYYHIPFQNAILWIVITVVGLAAISILLYLIYIILRLIVTVIHRLERA
jgi:polyferredoxin